jgi:hypothetical protein
LGQKYPWCVHLDLWSVWSIATSTILRISNKLKCRPQSCRQSKAPSSLKSSGETHAYYHFCYYHNCPLRLAPRAPLPALRDCMAMPLLSYDFYNSNGMDPGNVDENALTFNAGEQLTRTHKYNRTSSRLRRLKCCSTISNGWHRSSLMVPGEKISLANH